MKNVSWTTVLLLGALAGSACTGKSAGPSVVIETYNARGIRPGAAVYVAMRRWGWF